MHREPSTEQLAAIFKALGDPTRLGIFQTLRGCHQAVEVNEAGECRPARSLSVGEVCCRIGGSTSTISFHLKELRLAGLIRMEKRGRWIYCSIVPEMLDLIASFASVEPANSCCTGKEDSAEELLPLGTGIA